jgi:hypothetical protein
MHCQKILGYKEGGEGVSHGICPQCKEEQIKLLEEMLEEQAKNESK